MITASAGEPPLRRRIVGAALVVLFLLGLAVRVNGLSVSFWMDEAWVANSLLEPTWRRVFYYPHWLQTTPPGFLALASGGLAVFGDSPFAFRLVPLVSGLVGLAAVARLGRRLAPPFALLAVLMVALSPTAIDYSRMLKQYSTELAVAALLMLTAWRYLESPTTGRYAALAATIASG
jgi:predicted membrane-bound mannosyltransferase